MVNAQWRRTWLVVCGLLVAALVLSACGDDPPEASEPVGQQSAQQDEQAEQAEQAQTSAAATSRQQSAEQGADQTAEQASEQEADAQAEPASEASEVGIGIDGGTAWRDLYETLGESERSCLREELGEARLQEVLDLPIIFEGDPEAWMATVYRCLEPERGRAVFVAAFMAEIAEDEEFEFSESEQACLRETVAELDPADTIIAMTSGADDSAAAAEFLSSVVSCIPDLFISGLVEELGVSMEDLSEEETACLREWAAELDWALLLGASDSDDAAVFLSAVGGIFGCIPELVLSDVLRDDSAVDAPPTEPDFGAAQPLAVGEPVEGALEDRNDIGVFAFEAEADRLYRIDVTLGTLDDSVLTLYDADEWQVAYNDDHAGSLASQVFWRAQESGRTYVKVSGYGAGSYTLSVIESEIVDDHGDSASDAASARVGERIRGALDYGGDVDVFKFSADAGQLYEIDVALDSLHDSVLRLLDSEGFQLAYNDDASGSKGSRIYWTATDAGPFYVEVSGFAKGAGSYTMTVTASDIADDHGGSVAEATRIVVGHPVAGTVDYEGDVDLFAFETEAGQLYQIDVEGRTLLSSRLALYDAAEWELASDNDQSDSPDMQIVWRAPDSATYYVAVGSHGTGTYAVIVTRSDLPDDHADSAAGATAVEVGASTSGVLEYGNDTDSFAFEAESGGTYEIEVMLGTLGDSVVELFDEDGSLLEYNDDHGDTLASRIEWTAPSSGTYYVQVRGYGSQGGSYTLAIVVR